MTQAVLEFKRAPKASRTQMETMLLGLDTVNTWRLPPCQRQLRVNDKVRQVAEGLKSGGGIISGVLTLGVLERGGDAGTYILDGQHRIEAFRMSELREAIADVRIIHFDDFSEMGKVFVDLNSHLVALRPDDVLRGLEGIIEPLRIIRKGCDFVGYDQVRRNPQNCSIVSMSTVIRCWYGSARETPASAGSAATLAVDMTKESATQLVEFLTIAKDAWGRDQEYWRLWGGLNLTLCMWLYRKLVLEKDRGIKRFAVLRPDQFRKCLMSVSASSGYVDWLLGRHLSERDRSPCYQRIKTIFHKRITDETGRKPMLPQPSWVVSR